MNKEVLLKLMNKYGFYSLKKEPFLYVQNETIGFSLTFKDPLYGELTRLFIPKSEQEAEDFLKKYHWYKKNGSKFNVEIKLSNYKQENPQISFVKDNQELSVDELLELSTENIIKKDTLKKNEMYNKKCQRTIFLLKEILQNKVAMAKDTLENYKKLQNELKAQTENLQKYLKKYSKGKISVADIETKEFANPIIAKVFPTVNTKEELEKQIDELINEIKNVEQNEDLIYQKYALIKLPLMIKDINAKVSLLEEYSKKKKGLFSKKENIEEKLDKIDEESVLKEIVTLENYKQNEINRLKEKYAMLPDLDKRTIGDFLIEFDNLNIEEPKIEEEKEVIKLSYEEIMEELEKGFDNRPNEEKRILILYHSILKHLLLKKTLISDKEIEEFINVLNNPNNIMIKIKYFRDIDLSSPKKFISSLKEEANKILSFSPDYMKGDINVFFKGPKIIKAEDYLFASNKRILSPSQNKENDMNFIASLKKGSPVFFIPNEITYDIENDENLIQKTKQPFFLIDMQKNELSKTNSDIINVVRYQNVFETQDKMNIVTNLKSINVDQYKKIEIERKD